MYMVRMSDDALETMSLAAIEAYCLGDGGGPRRIELETFGYIWGHKKVLKDCTLYYVTKLGVSLAAKRNQNWVAPHPEASALQSALMYRMAPQLSMLGDFHTHPYPNLDEVRQTNGYDFSDADFDHLLYDDFTWAETNNTPLMLVMTICRLRRVQDSEGTQERGNLASFSIGEFKFWVNASVGYVDGTQTRRYTPNARSNVFLDLNSRFINIRSDRI